MSASLLISTKFSPPRLGSHAIARKSLLGKLHEARQARMFLLTGGAGYGKTTTLVQWRQQLVKDGAEVAWLSLTPEDNVFESFCASLINVLRQAGVPLADGLLLLSEAGVDQQLLAASLTNVLASQSKALYLVFDDFHHLSEPRIERLVQALLDNLPQHVHLVLASRFTPNLLLGRLRARGELCEVDSVELSFNFDESRDFLRTNLDRTLDVDTIHALYDQADGWPIGLQLLSISHKSNPRRVLGTRTFRPGQALETYFSEDVLAELPAELLDFLGKISILRRFNAPLAAYLTQMPNAEALIQEIEARNLFFQRIDVPGKYQWYRLHRMFADFLYQRLQVSGSNICALNQRAMEWFEQAGLAAESIRHALLTQELDFVVALLERMPLSYKNISHLGQFIRWLDRLPMALLVRHTKLMLLGIWSCLLTLHTEKAEAWVTALGRIPNESDWGTQLILIKASIAMQRDDMAECLSLLEPLGEDKLTHALPEHYAFLEQVRVGLAIASLSSMGRHAEVRRYYNSALARPLRSSVHELALIGQVGMAQVALTEGNVLEAERIAGDILGIAEARHGRRSVSACNCAALMSGVLYELDRLDEAREMLADRQDILRFTVPECRISAARTYARLLFIQDSPRSAFEFLKKQEEQFRNMGLDRGVAFMLAGQVRCVLASDERRHAEVLQVALDDLLPNMHESSPKNAEIAVLKALSLARIGLARWQPEMALQVLAGVQNFANEYGRRHWQVWVDILRAMALDYLGRDIEVQDLLSGAVAMGYRLGLRRTFLDEGEALRKLLLRLAPFSDPALAAYHADIVRDLPVDGAGAGTRQGRPVAASNGEQVFLTKREQEILALLEQSMSNKRIALALNLSLETVKWNLKNIFVKLGVVSRYEAIIIARKHD